MQVPSRGASARPGTHWIDAIANPVRGQIVRALSARGERTIAQLARVTHADPQTLRRHLRALTAAGVVVAAETRDDGRPGRPAVTFELDASVREPVRDALGAPAPQSRQA